MGKQFINYEIKPVYTTDALRVTDQLFTLAKETLNEFTCFSEDVS